MAPELETTRWHGTVGSMLVRISVPTARAAFALPARFATSAYVNVAPAGMRRTARRTLALKLLEVLEDFIGMAFGRDLLVDLGDLAFGVDEESVAQDAHVLSAHEFLLGPDAVGVQHRLLLV